MHPDDLNVVNKIENLFAHDIGFFSAQKDLPKKSLFSKFKTKNINSVFSFLLKKLYSYFQTFLRRYYFLVGCLTIRLPPNYLHEQNMMNSEQNLILKFQLYSMKAFSPS
jgi:hypothetical protein